MILWKLEHDFANLLPSWLIDLYFVIYSGVPGRSFSKSNSLHVELSSDTLEPTSFQHRLQRSKTERLRHETIFAEDAAHILDIKIPIDQKVFEKIQSVYMF